MALQDGVVVRGHEGLTLRVPADGVEVVRALPSHLRIRSAAIDQIIKNKSKKSPRTPRVGRAFYLSGGSTETANMSQQLTVQYWWSFGLSGGFSDGLWGRSQRSTSSSSQHFEERAPMICTFRRPASAGPGRDGLGRGAAAGSGEAASSGQGAAHPSAGWGSRSRM